MKSDLALQALAPYYLLTQVRRPRVARIKIREILRGLELGRIGAQVIIPNSAPLIAAITTISACVLVRPIQNPSESPAVGILAGWENLPGKLVHWDSTFVEVDEMPEPKSLVHAVMNVGQRMRPELTDAELQAGAEVIAAGLPGNEKLVEPLDESELHDVQIKVREAIELVQSRSTGWDSPEVS
jgi:ribosomal protein L30/L7E